MAQGAYRIRNTVNGKVYIGGTTNFVDRWRYHRVQLKSGRHSSKALLADFWEFGLRALVFEIVEEVADPADIKAAEQRHLDALQPFDPARCYNVHLSAKGPEGVKRTPETRAKQSAALTGRPHDAERIANISKGRRESPRAKAAVVAFNATKRALTYTDAEEIRRLHASGVTAAELGRRYGLTRNPIRMILDRKTYVSP
jgi:group I intron endonuclease